MRMYCAAILAACLFTAAFASSPSLQAPRARLTYTGQEGPEQPYIVTGFPGCAGPGFDVICTLADGTEWVAARVGEDGSFSFQVRYESGRSGVAISVRDIDGSPSPSLDLRLDYPHLPSIGGWVEYTAAAVDEEADQQEREKISSVLRERRKKRDRMVQGWLKDIGQPNEMDAYRAGFVPPDSLQLPRPKNSWEKALESTVPEDIKVYGYVPEGDTVTCIMGANQRSFIAPVREDGRFSVVIPYEALEASKGYLATFIVNISGPGNRLVAAHAANPGNPRWSAQRQRDKEKAALIGRQAPGFALDRLDGSGTVELKAYKGKNVLISVWATWCSPCIRELPVIQDIHAQLEPEKGQVLSISLDRDVQQARNLLEKAGYTFPVLSDTARTMQDLYSAYWVPMNILVDRQGIVRMVEYGDLSKEQVLAALRE